METIAKLNYLRIAPRKVRQVADLIRGEKAEQAQKILNFTQKKAALSLLKLLNSAISNANHNFQSDIKDLQISKLLVEEGPKLKRWRPRARGQAYEIQKKTSHITIILKEIKAEKKLAKKKVSEEKKAIITEPKKEEIVKGAKEKKLEKIKKAKLMEKKQRITEARKPRVQRGIKRIFRRKAF